MLQPFISPSELQALFGRNVLENDRLYPTLLELVGKADSKPFECVGTHEESLVAAHLSVQMYQRENLPLPALLARLQQDVLSHENELDQRAATILESWGSEHTLPNAWENLLQQRVHVQ